MGRDGQGWGGCITAPVPSSAQWGCLHSRPQASLTLHCGALPQASNRVGDEAAHPISDGKDQCAWQTGASGTPRAAPPTVPERRGHAPHPGRASKPALRARTSCSDGHVPDLCAAQSIWPCPCAARGSGDVVRATEETCVSSELLLIHLQAHATCASGHTLDRMGLRGLCSLPRVPLWTLLLLSEHSPASA